MVQEFAFLLQLHGLKTMGNDKHSALVGIPKCEISVDGNVTIYTCLNYSKIYRLVLDLT